MGFFKIFNCFSIHIDPPALSDSDLSLCFSLFSTAE